MTELRRASLILTNSILTAGAINLYGEMNANKTSMTFYNINLRTILGDMYNQYDNFNLSLTAITTALNINASANRDQLAYYTQMSGLQWINCNYDVKSGKNTRYAIIGCVNYVNNNTALQMYNNNFLTFGKNSDNCDITINLLKIVDDTLPTLTAPLGNTMFIFDIIGVPNKLFLKDN